MSTKTLKNRPLVEAILEVKWSLPSQGDENQHKSEYPLLPGRLAEKFKDDYPHYELHPDAEAHGSSAPYAPQHRFRTSENSWPLIQIGNGLMTVNDLENYQWDDFRGRCERAVKILTEAYLNERELELQEITLNYLDAIDLDPSQENVFHFLQHKLKMKAKLPKVLFHNAPVLKDPAAFSWMSAFLTDDDDEISIKMDTGKMDHRPALIWQTTVRTTSKSVHRAAEDFSNWLTGSHDLLEDWFFKMIEGELEKEFSGEQ